MSLPLFDHDHATKFTEMPNPAWSYGQSIDSTPAGKAWLGGEAQGWTTVNTAEHSPLGLFRLMDGGLVPRPLAFVSTVSEDGVGNLAPFSWFNQVSSSPPIVSFSCFRTPRIKDTEKNVKNGNGFTVNIVSEPFIEGAHATSIDSPAGFDEWPITGLTKAPSVHVKAPRVKESAFSMECDLFQTIDIIDPDSGAHAATLVLGHVKYIHIRNDVLNERGVVDITKFKPVSRLGDRTYARVGDVFRMPRAVWETEKAKVQDSLQRLGDRTHGRVGDALRMPRRVWEKEKDKVEDNAHRLQTPMNTYYNRLE